MGKKVLSILICVMLFVSFNGCVSLRTDEKYDYEQVERRLSTVGLEPEKSKDPTVAGTLNILPGIGNIYNGQWGLFALNLLFWPLSVVWGVPQAAIDANTMNKQDTLYYYNTGAGKQRLEKLEQQKGITQQPVQTDVSGNMKTESSKDKDLYTELLKLEDLRKKNILTEDEFQDQKRILLLKQK